MTNVSLNLAIEAALVAGEAILSFYKSDVTYINKKDNTPLTKADSASNNLICKKLFDAGKIGLPAACSFTTRGAVGASIWTGQARTVAHQHQCLFASSPPDQSYASSVHFNAS